MRLEKQLDLNKMKQELISVIIPLYNAEKYIAKCIESVINQDYESWELIVIDDGSKDNSFEIAQKYVSDKRIKVIHQDNSGVSQTRNNGIELAKGKYITFIDSDDYVESNYLSLLAEHMKEGVSFVSLGLKKINSDGSFVNSARNIEAKEYAFNEYKDEALDDGTMAGSPLDKVTSTLFRLDLIKKYNLRFHTDIKFREDGLFTSSYFYRAKMNIYVDFSLTPYIYLENEHSSTNTRDFLSKDFVDECKKFEDEVFLNCKDSISEESFKTQIYRKRATFFMVELVLLNNAKKLTFKTYKSMVRTHDILTALKYIDFSKMKKGKSLFVKLLKSRFYLTTYFIFKIKFSK